MHNDCRYNYLCCQDGLAQLESVRKLLGEQCKADANCKGVSVRHKFEHTRINMQYGLIMSPLNTQKQLVDFLASAV